MKRVRGRHVGAAAMLHVCFATHALADWALVMPPSTTNTDCTITYREDVPVARPRPQRFSRWGAPLGWVTKWLFDPSSWEECERRADYWALEHTRCTER